MLLTPFFVLAMAASNPSGLATQGCDFGEVHAFSDAECMARIENHADRPVTLAIALSGSGTHAPIAAVSIAARGSSVVPLRVRIENETGDQARYFTVSERGSHTPLAYLKMTGFVISALDELHPKFDFGAVPAGEQAVKEMTLASREAPRFRVTRVLAAPPQLDVTILGDGQTLRAQIRKDAAWGVLDGFIKVAIDTPLQKEAWVAVHGMVHGKVVADANPASFKPVIGGQDQTVMLTSLRSVDGNEFPAGRISVEGIDGSGELVPCVPNVGGCRLLYLTISKAQPLGPVQGVVTIPFPAWNRSLRVAMRGGLSKPQLVPDAGNVTKSEAPRLLVSEQAPAKSTTTSGVSSEASSGGAAVPPAAGSTEPPPGRGPLLKWAARDERSVHGYQVYRADAEAGPYVLLNSPTIPARSRSEFGSSYQWRDTSAKKGSTYWYYVGVVYNDGRKEKITPEMKALAK